MSTYDAGSISASLSVDTAKAGADLDKIAAKVRALEDKRHVIKISAVFDDASSSKARTAFAALDNAISRDAMQRLRSSPQGSVLGALNALFSPHPVSGAPSPQQAASQGLLGKIFGPQGGGTTSMPGGGGSTVIRDVVTGQNAPQKVTVTQAGSGQGAGSDQAARDLEVAAGDQKAAADDLRSAADGAKDTSARMRDSAGRLSSAAGKAGQAADEQKSAARDLSGAASGVRGVFDSLRKLFGGSGGGAGGASAGRLAAGLLGGIGPGIIGAGAKTGLITAGAGSLLGALPALFGGISPLLAAAPGLAGLGALAAGSIKQVSPILQAQQQAQQALAAAVTPQQVQAAQQQMAGVRQQVNQLSPALKSVYGSIGQISSAWQSLSGSFAPVMAAGLRQVAQLFSSLLPDLRQFFAASASLMQPLIGGLGDIARSLLPLFTQAIRAAAPEIRPLLDGLGSLVSGLFPGLITLVRASAPAVKALGAVLGTLGADLGKMLAAFAPVLRQSVMIFQPLLDVISALFPVIGKLAAVFAQALGPVFTQFGSVIRSLLPALTVIGKVLGALAAAVLGDLVSAFTAVARLLTAIAPALSAFAQAFSSVFTVLENTGIFATLGDALENIVPLLANLINALLKGLTPILPVVIGFLSQLSVIMVNGLTQALTAVLPPLTQLATTVLQALATVLPVILPVLTQVFAVFTSATAGAITAIAKGLLAVVNAIPKPALDVLAGVATTLLILKKTGVISLGIKVVGLAKNLWAWLSGSGSGTVDVASAGMQKAGDTMADAAAAMNRAADKIAGAAAEEGPAGAAASGEGAAAGAGSTAAGAGAGFAATLRAALPAAAAGVTVGAGIKAVGDALSPKGTLAGKLNDMFQGLQVQALQSFTFGGLEGWLTAKVGEPAGAFENSILAGAKMWSADVARTVTSAWETMAAGAARWWGDITSTLTGTWADLKAGAALWIGDIKTGIAGGWSSIAAGAVTWWDDITSTLTGAWHAIISGLGSDFVTPFENAMKGAWDWVVSNVLDPVEAFVTKTVPGWFDAAVSAIGSAWGKIESAVSGPVNFVIGILNDLGQAFDDITSALGLGKPIGTIPGIGGGGGSGGGSKQVSKAQYGMKIPGYGGGDKHLILAEAGELILPKEAADDPMAVMLAKKYGVPGYQFGGIAGFLAKGTLQALKKIGGDVASLASPVIDKALNAFTKLGTDGAGGLLGKIITAVPQKIVSGMESWITGQARTTTPGPGGPASAGLVSVAKYLLSHGASKAAAAGIAGVIAGESGGNPEILEAGGGGGAGLLQWTPASSAFPYQPIITGNVGKDMATQLADMMAYIASRGGLGLINAAAKSGTLAGAMAAASVFSRMEAPAVPGSDIDAGAVSSLFAQGYDRGGWLKPGLTLALNGTGRPEAVIPAGNYGMRPGGAYAIAQSAPAAAAPGPAGDLAGEVRAMRLELCKRLDNLTGVAAAIPRGTGEHVGYALGGAAQSASFRNRYPRSGA